MVQKPPKLHQYLTYDEEKNPANLAKKPKRVIKLDDKPEPAGKKE